MWKTMWKMWNLMWNLMWKYQKSTENKNNNIKKVHKIKE